MTSANSARNTPQVPQTTGDTQYNVHNAALRGASSAFTKPPVKPKPQVNTYTGGNNGALLAATKVATGTPRNAPTQGTASPIRRDWTGGSYNNRPSPSPMRHLSTSSSASTLAVPDDFLFDRTPSPSNIAAKLAAARFSPMKPIPSSAPVSGINEKDANERDVLPQPGSVRNVLARLDSRTPTQQPLQRGATGSSHSVATTVRVPVDDNKPTDDTPIPPTKSLLKIFEQSQPTATRHSLAPLVVSQKAPPPVRSPKPQRKIKLPPEPPIEEPLQRTATRSPPCVRPKPPRLRTLSMDGVEDIGGMQTPQKDLLGSPTVTQKPAQLTAIKTANIRPKPPPQRGARQSRPMSDDISHSALVHRRLSTSMSLESNENASSPSSFVSAKEEQFEEKPKPSLPPPRRSTFATPRPKASKIDNRPQTTASMPPKPSSPRKMQSPLQVPVQFSPPPRLPASSPTSDTIYHSNYQRESVRKITKHMTGESLSNAIVGAALASSRTASPAPSSTATPPLPARRQQHHHHSPLHLNRSPSPQKPTGKMRMTMRKEPSSSSEEDEGERYKKKGTRVMGLRRKHPNKHHEGTRKRWRDAITERERKRYEGVWAANKGMYIQARSSSRLALVDDPALDVVNVVIQEIWQRSRLPEHVLEEVWDLVDGRGVGRLKREEFVVGMWLIDQRLKGRKLPQRVSESVWDSVKGVGVKVKVGTHNHGPLHHK